MAITLARTFIPLVAITTGSYFLIIRPQKKQRLLNNMIQQNLRPGAIATTTNGLQGTIIFVTHNTVILELATGEKIEALIQTLTTIALPPNAHEKI